MQIDELFCQIKGHEGHKLCHICIFLECICASRWLCSECVKKQIHNHNDGIHGFSYYRTENEFMSYFKMKIQPLIQLRLNSQDGNLIKYKYLRKIYLDLQYLNIKQSFEKYNQDNFYKDLISLQELICNLINNYENERILAQDINKINQQLCSGLRFLKNDEINFLINIDTNSQTIEVQVYKEILYQAKKYNTYLNTNKNAEYQETIIKILKDASKRLIKLKDFINYQQYHCIFYEQISFDNVYLSQNGRFLAVVDYKYNQLKLSDLQSKMLIKQHQFKFRLEYLALDSQWKYLIIYYSTCLYYYLFNYNTKSIKLIKKQKIGQYIRGHVVINVNRILIIFEKSFQIRDFKNRCVNQINLEQDSDIYLKIVNLGVISNIIVVIIGDIVDSIYIYKDYERHPFIRQNNNEELEIQIKQIALTKDDLYLLTQDTYELKLWQIDYQRQQLIIINRIQINKLEYCWFSYNSSDYNIIRSLNGYLQILDKNFNVICEIMSQRQFIPDKIMISKHFLLTLDYVNGKYSHKINILKQAQTNYDRLLE